MWFVDVVCVLCVWMSVFVLNSRSSRVNVVSSRDYLNFVVFFLFVVLYVCLLLSIFKLML